MSANTTVQNPEDLDERIAKVVRILQEKWKIETLPSETVMVILGSGFKGVESQLSQPISVDLENLHSNLRPSVSGHGSSLIMGSLNTEAPSSKNETRNERRTIIQTGRIHLYEEKTAHDVVMTIRAVARLGCRNLLITNAAGGLRKDLSVGQVLALQDQINLTGTSPLLGEGQRLGEPFLDMSEAFNSEWLGKICDNLNLKQGVYAGVQGPAYETPAECHMLKMMGADIVGMSTVLEVIAARHQKMNVAGLSLVTNVAGGGGGTIHHEDVLQQANSAHKMLVKTLKHSVTLAPHFDEVS